MDELTDSPAPGGDDYQAALAQGYVPIREVARITGVNAVTLRAWERRYGLIVPHRTPKGHRLYSADHVARIQAILTWLGRGVSVSQVKGLLRSGQAVFSEAGSLWEETRSSPTSGGWARPSGPRAGPPRSWPPSAWSSGCSAACWPIGPGRGSSCWSGSTRRSVPDTGSRR
jgi:DNA-binding transcriptional MerR regulator